VEKLETIVVPVDFSPLSKRAFRTARLVGSPAGAEIHLIHVIPEYEEGHVFHIRLPTRAEMESLARESIEKEFEKFLHGEALEGLNLVQAVRYGKPARVICEYATEVGADLILIASHGRSGFERAVFGSVTERVLRTSKQTVMIVKPA
jgi:nucleotide-binding universal stress UspA family protein